MQPRPHKLIIGSRGSPLALAQSHWVREKLLALHPRWKADSIEIKSIVTRGDQITDRKLSPIGGKGLFTEEIEKQLLSGNIDLAVHSMKDMPTRLPAGLMLGPVPQREDPRDVLIAQQANSIASLPQGARLGTASLRRQAQVLAVRPDIKITLLRGNVGTRLAKVLAGEVDATILAHAGINRLGLSQAHMSPLSMNEILPAPGQGALALELRSDDKETLSAISKLSDNTATLCVAAERAALASLDGDCRTPLAIHAQFDGGQLSIKAELLMPDGSKRQQIYYQHQVADEASAHTAGEQAGAMLLKKAGADFIAQLRRSL